MTEDDLSWSEEDDAHLHYESLPDHHPSLFVDVFRTALTYDPDRSLEVLKQAFVTPESVETWGDFSRARAIFDSGLRISMSAWYARGAPDVAYVRLVETDQHFSPIVDEVPASVHVTLVWRPELSADPTLSWRIHSLGNAVEPQAVPRSALGVDPRQL